MHVIGVRLSRIGLSRSNLAFVIIILYHAHKNSYMYAVKSHYMYCINVLTAI